MIRRPPRSTPKPSSAASDVYKRQEYPLRAFGIQTWVAFWSRDGTFLFRHLMYGTLIIIIIFVLQTCPANECRSLALIRARSLARSRSRPRSRSLRSLSVLILVRDGDDFCQPICRCLRTQTHTTHARTHARERTHTHSTHARTRTNIMRCTQGGWTRYL